MKRLTLMSFYSFCCRRKKKENTKFLRRKKWRNLLNLIRVFIQKKLSIFENHFLFQTFVVRTMIIAIRFTDCSRRIRQFVFLRRCSSRRRDSFIQIFDGSLNVFRRFFNKNKVFNAKTNQQIHLVTEIKTNRFDRRFRNGSMNEIYHFLKLGASSFWKQNNLPFSFAWEKCSKSHKIF